MKRISMLQYNMIPVWLVQSQSDTASPKFFRKYLLSVMDIVRLLYTILWHRMYDKYAPGESETSL
jgi:hypothetical protein